MRESIDLDVMDFFYYLFIGEFAIYQVFAQQNTTWTLTLFIYETTQIDTQN